MTHPHALYVSVEVPCWCCHTLQPFQFTSASDQVVCTHCLHHLGTAKAERRDTDHIAMWSELLTDARQDAATFLAATVLSDTDNNALISSLEGQVAELTVAIASDFAASPGAAVRTALQNELLTRAERTTTLAYRRLDRTMAVLWNLANLHHDDPDRAGFCTCGKATAQCPDGRAIDPERQELLAWETRNIQLLRDGQRHGLPSAHPQVVGASAPAPAARTSMSGDRAARSASRSPRR